MGLIQIFLTFKLQVKIWSMFIIPNINPPVKLGAKL